MIFVYNALTRYMKCSWHARGKFIIFIEVSNIFIGTCGCRINFIKFVSIFENIAGSCYDIARFQIFVTGTTDIMFAIWRSEKYLLYITTFYHMYAPGIVLFRKIKINITKTLNLLSLFIISKRYRKIRTSLCYMS